MAKKTINKKKNKHIYSDSKKNGLTREIKAFKGGTVDLHNPMTQIETLYHLYPTEWSSYIGSIMYDKDFIKRKDFWEDPSLILNEIPDKNLQMHILECIRQDEGYSPFVDLFPTYTLDEATKNLVIKKQKYLKNNYGKAFTCMHKNYIITIMHNFNRLDLKDLHEFSDIVIIYNSYSTIVSIAKEIKDCFDLKTLCDNLNQIENDTWTTNTSKTMLYVKNKKSSKIRIYDNEDIFSECMDIIITKDADERVENRKIRYIEKLKSNGVLEE